MLSRAFAFASPLRCFSTYAREPSRPSSSPPQSATRIVRFGCAPTAFNIRIASIAAATASALSVAPVAECHESRCAPSSTTSFLSTGSVPGISAITL